MIAIPFSRYRKYFRSSYHVLYLHSHRRYHSVIRSPFLFAHMSRVLCMTIRIFCVRVLLMYSPIPAIRQYQYIAFYIQRVFVYRPVVRFSVEKLCTQYLLGFFVYYNLYF